MRTYEFSLVLNQEAGKDDKEKQLQVDELLKKVKAKIKSSKILGLRDLSYPIKKQDKGWYGIFVIELEEASVPELDKLATQSEIVLRYLLVREG